MDSHDLIPTIAADGWHIVADIHVPTDTPPFTSAELERACRRAATAANATVLAVARRDLEPFGATVLLLLAESHISVHTWPEHGWIAVDVFTCGTRMQPGAAFESLVEDLGARVATMTRLRRTPPCRSRVSTPAPHAVDPNGPVERQSLSTTGAGREATEGLARRTAYWLVAGATLGAALVTIADYL